MDLYVFHFLTIAPAVDLFTLSYLPIIDSLFPAMCRSTVLFLVPLDTSLVMAMVESECLRMKIIDLCHHFKWENLHSHG